MEKLKNRLIFLICSLTITSTIVWAHRSSYGVWRQGSTLRLPLNVGQWTGKEEIPTERIYRLLEADTVIIRKYFKGDNEIWFAGVYYRDNQVGFHRPEACFGGLGYKVFKEEVLNFYVPDWDRTVKINQLHYKGNGREKILYYFYEAGDYITESYVKMRVKMLSDQLGFKKPGVALFELYSPAGKGGVKRAKENLKDFLSHLIPKLPCYLKRVENLI